MSALLSSLAADRGDLDVTRRAVLDAATRAGLPGARSERWKYTSLRALERRQFTSSVEMATVDPAELAQIPAPRLVFVNGIHNPALSDLAGLADGLILRAGEAMVAATSPASTSDHPDPADDVFAQVNAALARSGVFLQSNANSNHPLPVHLVFVGIAVASDKAWHLRHRIEVADAANMTIVEHHIGLGNHQHLANHMLQIRLGRNAVLHHARIQHEADGATLIQRSDVMLAAHSDYRRIDLELGAGLSRHELNASLVGKHASLRSGGVLLANGRRHLDTRLDIRHVARDTVCDLRWRGLADDRSRAVFHGGIVIQAGADGSDARLSNKNLLLSANAEIDAQPVLEIHADEVKAAHGATVGKLDESALFYLRSRGLSLVAAQRLLTAAFCRETLSVLDDAALLETLSARIDSALTQIGIAT